MPKICAVHCSVPSVSFMVQTVSAKRSVSESFMKWSGVINAAMIAAPTHGSIFSFFAAL